MKQHYKDEEKSSSPSSSHNVVVVAVMMITMMTVACHNKWKGEKNVPRTCQLSLEQFSSYSFLLLLCHNKK